MEVVLLIPDVSDRAARHLDQLFAGDGRRASNLAGENDLICRDQRLDAAASFGFGSQKRINDRVGNAVANLVRMPLRDGFAGEYVIAVSQEFAFPLERR